MTPTHQHDASWYGSPSPTRLRMGTAVGTGPVDPTIDKGCGRVMSDVSSMYIIYLVELLRWGGDSEIVKELWPVAAKVTFPPLICPFDDAILLFHSRTYCEFELWTVVAYVTFFFSRLFLIITVLL